MTAPQKAQSPGGAGQSADSKTEIGIVPQSEPDRKAYHTVQALFACAGHELNLSRRVGDGRCTWTVSRWGHSRHFSHWGDVLAFLTQIGGAP